MPPAHHTLDIKGPPQTWSTWSLAPLPRHHCPFAPRRVSPTRPATHILPATLLGRAWAATTDSGINKSWRGINSHKIVNFVHSFFRGAARPPLFLFVCFLENFCLIKISKSPRLNFAPAGTFSGAVGTQGALGTHGHPRDNK